MKSIVIQGFTEHCGTTSIVASLAWSLSKVRSPIFLVNANKNDSDIEYLLNVDKQSSGWYDNPQSFNNAFHIDLDLFLIPFGTTQILEKETEAKISLLKQRIEQINPCYALVDAGVRNKLFSSNFVKNADLVITIVEPDSNNINKLKKITLGDNEFILINKYDSRSKIFSENEKELRKFFNNKILEQQIQIDEFMNEAFHRHQPISRYLSFAASSVELEKVIIDIILKTQQ